MYWVKYFKTTLTFKLFPVIIYIGDIMKLTSSYTVELKQINKILNYTVKVYREALAFLIDVFDSEWEDLYLIKDKQKRAMYAEKLIHNTKNNIAKYDFDSKFYKMPCYLRRDLTNTALGIVSSYKTNLKNWEKSKQTTNKPVLQTKHFAMPVFYRDNMYIQDSDYTCRLKLFYKNDWVWVSVKMLKTDVNYLKKYWSHVKASAPKLEKKHKKWFLRFAFTEDVNLNETITKEQIICSVDLGINTAATCSIMLSDGTVAAMKFIDFAAEKDHLGHVLNRIKRKQREHGSQSVYSFWKYATRLNEEIAKKVALEIVSFASEYMSDVIVFEYLDMNGKIFGSKKQKLHLWKKRYIQELVTHKAHRIGMRVARVNAQNTSKLAFDGSGEVIRNKTNCSICTFQSGKIYNCDLSASYNIGARYFIRELLKPLSERVRSEIQAKVPDSLRRTTCTLDTLKKVNKVLELSVS